MGFPERLRFFQKTAKGSKFAVDCDWKSNTSRNVQNLVLINELYRFFERTNDFFEKKPQR